MKSEIDLTITELGAQGDGIATTNDGPVYVPFALPGEIVRALPERSKDGRIFAQLTEIVSPSPARVMPECPHFTECGGCVLQHFASSDYTKWKCDLITTALARKGITGVNIGPMQISPPGSRRRARFSVLKRKGKVSLGFNAKRSRQIVDMQTCTVLRPRIVGVLPELKALLDATIANGDEIEVQVTDSDAGLDIWLIVDGALDLAKRERLVAFAEAQDIARISWGEPPELLAERRPPVIDYGGIKLAPPTGAFLQATVEGETSLITLICSWLRGSQAALDLYAGCGAFALSLGKHMKVHAVDIAGDHLDALDKARRFARNMREISVERRNLKRRPVLANEMKEFDALVFDPPRAGAKEQCEEIAASDLSRVVAVSCNPSTFARDAQILACAGFEMTELVPVDQFLWNPHVELAARFERRAF
jgi:23S rRNA (uracil1939-C5)-methyltransferase